MSRNLATESRRVGHNISRRRRKMAGKQPVIPQTKLQELAQLRKKMKRAQDHFEFAKAQHDKLDEELSTRHTLGAEVEEKKDGLRLKTTLIEKHNPSYKGVVIELQGEKFQQEVLANSPIIRYYRSTVTTK